MLSSQSYPTTNYLYPSRFLIPDYRNLTSRIQIQSPSKSARIFISHSRSTSNDEPNSVNRSPFIRNKPETISRWPLLCGNSSNALSADGSDDNKRSFREWVEVIGEAVSTAFPVWVALGCLLGLVKPSSFSWVQPKWTVMGITLTMLGMGMTLTFDDLRSALAMPKELLSGFLLQYSIMPLSGFFVSKLLNLPSHYAAGLILVGCCPGGTASNIVTYIARGNVALSVLMTAASTLSAVVGAFLNQYFQRLVKVVSPVMPPIAVATVAVLCGNAIAQSSSAILTSGLQVVLATTLLHSSGFFFGYFLARMLGIDVSSSRTISIEVGMQNSVLGVVLATQHFGNPLTAVPCAVSSVCHSIFGSALAGVWRRSQFCVVSVLAIVFFNSVISSNQEQFSAIGDPGMRRDGLRIAIEAWNQCNEVGEEAPEMGSPRQADCFDIDNSTSPISLIHRVTERENKLGISDAFYQGLWTTTVDQYAAWKELYLGDKCEVKDEPKPWQFWMIMLKSGNMDTMEALCPKNGRKVLLPTPETGFPCFGKGCMNMPQIYHNYTTIQEGKLKGSFYGTWDLDNDDIEKARTDNNSSYSYYAVTWEKEVEKGGWNFHHYLKTSKKYPWLMLYLRSDATVGFSGGYHYQTRGMLKRVPKSPNFKVRFTLEVMHGGGPRSQFYLMDIGSCWKNNGHPCSGDVTSDVTRYSEMILNPSINSWCNPHSLGSCPPYHTLPNGTRIHRTDKNNFPYEAYHLYCSPGNAEHLEEPYNLCDPYSNPQPQEILQILPHPVWGVYGYPTKRGEGWIGDPRTWELDVGKLSDSLYFYQDPGTPPAKRSWPSIDLGTEIFISENEHAEWRVGDFDIIIWNSDN
nr:uncharacterized protein LOC109187820 [Ipomoea trifida]